MTAKGRQPLSDVFPQVTAERRRQRPQAPPQRPWQAVSGPRRFGTACPEPARRPRSPSVSPDGDWRPGPDGQGCSLGAATTTDTERSLQLREEQLQARKTPVETGRVELGKQVVEEQRRLEVPVTREEVYVERRPVERHPSDQPIGATETETIRVPVREEQVEVEKQPVVYEEVGVGKRVSQATRQVADTVRREELRTDNQGEVEVRDDPTP